MSSNKIKLEYICQDVFVSGHISEDPYEIELSITSREDASVITKNEHVSYDGKKRETVISRIQKIERIVFLIDDVDYLNEISYSMRMGQTFGINWSRDGSTFQTYELKGQLSISMLSPNLYSVSFSAYRD